MSPAKELDNTASGELMKKNATDMMGETTLSKEGGGKGGEIDVPDVTFSAIMQELGDMKLYQCLITLCMATPLLFCAMHGLSLGYIMAIPDHRCFIEGYDTDNTMSHSANETAVLNASIPWDDKRGAFSQCYMYTNSSPREIQPCEQWAYDKSLYKSSRGMDWNIVCDRKNLNYIAQAMYMAGMLVGSLIFGTLSDRFGRKPLLVASVLSQAVCGILLLISPSYTYFVICRFLLGALHCGAYNTGFVIVMENVGPKGQVFGGVLHGAGFGTGFVLVAVLGYGIHHWDQMQMAITIPEFLLIIYIWIIPESPRWLVQNGRMEEAEAILRRIARVNKVPLRPDITKCLARIQGSDNTEKKKANLFDLLRTPNLRKRSLIAFYQWFVISMVYWGISMNGSKLPGGDQLANTLIAGLVEFPALTLTALCLFYWGRKPALVISVVLAGMGCIIAAAVPKEAGDGWAVVSLAMLAKLGASSGFVMTFQYTGEAFPTVVRNTSVGSGSLCARIGSLLAPFIYLLGDVSHEMLPIVTFGILSILAAGLALLLPETTNQPLPETIEDGELFGTPGYKQQMMHKALENGEAAPLAEDMADEKL